MTSASKIFLGFISAIGIATKDDIVALRIQIEIMNRKSQQQINDMRNHLDDVALNFADHKKKTEKELRELVEDIKLIIKVMHLLLQTAQTEYQIVEIKGMIKTLKTKETKATNVIKRIGLANSEGQLDVALAEAANG